jgi:hypothetical protein
MAARSGVTASDESYRTMGWTCYSSGYLGKTRKFGERFHDNGLVFLKMHCHVI